MRSLALLCCLAGAVAQSPPPAPRAVVRQAAGEVEIDLDTPFTTLRWRDLSRPVLWPLRTARGVAVTRAWPLQPDAIGDAKDHVHQKSLWFAHGDVNGVDFWTEAKGAGRIEVEAVDRLEVAAQTASVQLRCRWLDAAGKVVCTDTRLLLCTQQDALRLLDYEVELCASHGELKLGDTKEGTMALRVAKGLCFDAKDATGRCLDSEGRTGGDVWGKRARWVAYGGTLDGQQVGVALLDHQDNLRHPTTWHARPYGLLAANPFGLHEFTKAEKGSGAVQLATGAKLPFRYRIVLFDGPIDAATLEAQWRAFVARKEPPRGGQAR